MYKRILCSHKMEWDTDTCYKVDEPWKHYARSKKPNTKKSHTYESIYTEYPRTGKSTDRMQIHSYQELEGGW